MPPTIPRSEDGNLLVHRRSRIKLADNLFPAKELRSKADCLVPNLRRQKSKWTAVNAIARTVQAKIITILATKSKRNCIDTQFRLGGILRFETPFNGMST